MPSCCRSARPLRAILHGLGLVEEAIGTLLIVVILVLVLVQVAQRYLPGGGWPWTGEVARLALVWCTFILSGYLMAHDRHMSIQLIDFVLPPQGPRRRPADGPWGRPRDMRRDDLRHVPAHRR